MDKLFLIASVALFVLAIKFHVVSQVHVKVKIKKEWYDRIWSGSRPARDNLTDEGLKCRRQSNMYAIAGFCTLAVYIALNATQPQVL